jgi:hypothetical protein
LPQDFQVAKDGPSADLAGQGQRLSVAPSSNLQKTDQLEQATDS